VRLAIDVQLEIRLCQPGDQAATLFDVQVERSRFRRRFDAHSGFERPCQNRKSNRYFAGGLLEDVICGVEHIASIG
jgi:hypothetical protein